MPSRGALRLVEPMNEDDRLNVVTERFERRLAEESGKTRAEIAVVRTEVVGLRAEMIERNAELLKWMLGFFLAQTAAVAGLLALFR